MSLAHCKIVKYSDLYRDQVLDVWEKSVLATHHFLDADDFIEIKSFVHSFDFNDLSVYCMMDNEEVIGFIGIAAQKIEMLFLSPLHIGKGLGKQLIDFAMSTLNLDKVDVSEQNTHAIIFYKKLGFETYERTDTDDQGKAYPLLRMKLKGK